MSIKIIRFSLEKKEKEKHNFKYYAEEDLTRKTQEN